MKVFYPKGEGEETPLPRPALPSGSGLFAPTPKAPRTRKTRKPKPACYAVVCPLCRADFGIGCFSKMGWRKRYLSPHEARIRAWERKRDQASPICVPVRECDKGGA